MVNDFEIWRSNPQNYFVRHRSLVISIFHQCYFAGHTDKRLIQQTETDLEHLMVSVAVTKRLMAYQGMTDFLLFYSKILKDVVVQYSQDEDLRLLHSDFHLLILKYKPLIDKLVDERIRILPEFEPERQDMIQQIFENLLSKHETILIQYDSEQNFRNYLWKIIKNECVNSFQRENKHIRRFVPMLQGNDEIFDPSDFYDDLVVKETFRIFDGIINSYTISKKKLVVCLKVILSVKISLFDLTQLFNDHQSGYSRKELEDISKNLTSGGETLRGILIRFHLIRPVLNLAEKANTDEHSYWRWTNQQIIHAINYLNNKHGMNFDRETLKILAEKYFEDFYDKQFQF